MVRVSLTVTKHDVAYSSEAVVYRLLRSKRHQAYCYTLE